MFLILVKLKREGEDTIGNTSKREGDISKYGQKDGRGGS